jgi:hypothetical protein
VEEHRDVEDEYAYRVIQKEVYAFKNLLHKNY